MMESDITDISDINVRDTIETNKIDNIIEDKKDLNSSLVSNNLQNSPKELIKVPESVKNYLQKNNCIIVSHENWDSPVQEIKAAQLQKTDNVRAKDFSFQFNEQTDYYFFITKEYNSNYLKQVVSSTNEKKKRFLVKEKEKENKENEANISNKIENKKIILNFDYNRYVLKAVVAKKKETGNLEIFSQIILNREICQVSHTTPDSISYYRTTKTIKPEKAKKNFDNFALLIPEKYYLIEIETKKPANETIIKEDGITSVLYLITPRKRTTIQLFTMVKYSIYFIKETLCNYIGKYIHDMIYDFCHLPSECFDDFLSHIGSIKKEYGNNGFCFD